MIALMLAIPSATGFNVTEVIVRPATPKLRLVGGTDMAKSELEAQVAQIEARRTAVEPGQTEFTVAQFCGQRGLELSMRDMQRMGKTAAKFSREAGLQISRVADELFGEVNAYRTQALEAASGVFIAEKLEFA